MSLSLKHLKHKKLWILPYVQIKNTVLVEASDCCGGEPSDSVNVIKLLIVKNLNKVSYSIIVDPKAVKNLKM